MQSKKEIRVMGAVSRNAAKGRLKVTRTWLMPAFVSMALAGCGSEPASDAREEALSVGFQEFEAACPREASTGAYLVQGDIPIWSKVELLEYYQSTLGQKIASPAGAGTAPRAETVDEGEIAAIQSPLAVHHVNEADMIWSAAQRTNLTYCVSTGFGTNQTAVITAMAAAASAWEGAADVDFVYSSGQNSNCTASNNNVVFDVRPTSGQSYLARAFFPNYARSKRNVLIDSSAFSSSTSLAGILRHELGHALGFRHEHTVGGTNTSCYEDEQWRALTAYDSASVMHYPNCGGTGSGALTLTTRDRNGAACLYGAAAGFTPNCNYRGVLYQAHVEGHGWLPTLRAGNIAGTVGQSRRLETLWAVMMDAGSVGICYRAHVQGIGWQSEVCNGHFAGTIGESRRLEAIRIRLTDAPSGCNVSYRAHVSGLGWQPTVSNGATAGTTGQGRAIEGLEIFTTGSCGF